MLDRLQRLLRPGAGDNPLAAQWRARFRAEMVSGIAFAFKARLLAILAIGVWLSISLWNHQLLPFYMAALLLAAASGLIVWLARATRWVASAHFLGLILDVGLICGVLLYPQPGHDAGEWALMLWLRRGIFLYITIYVALNALTYSPAMVLISGFVATVGIVASYAYVVGAVDGGMATLQRALGPHLMTPTQFVSNQLVLLLIACGLIAAAVWRARRHVMRSVEAARERSNLARYFSPNLVDRLADADRSFEDGRAQVAAVLFVDIVGFTRLMEGQPPDGTVAMLRAFHKRMAATVFQHQGTLDKFIGDGLMATFGTPETAADDAIRALHCALGMVDAVTAWNRQRHERRLPPVRIAVGVHIGPVMLGTIGSPERLEFTVMGDTVNIASRLERLTREHDAVVMASDDLLQAARAAGASKALLRPFTEMGAVQVPGREAPVAVWKVPRAGNTEPGAPALSPRRETGVTLGVATHSHY